ncbi:hypothetical protein EBI01_08130 [Marinomonas rhizomae]|uniref:Uncharacterized protein n=1 Tax=Marinomonas rhizomae TaxID=491948 RepID=A0A366J6P8_9GAMM|nr:hypothetical protein [Marinomonas rhizomae]RBP82537.1 hypothetical protein DFP80_108184 [Marinomonas rhizomae]RNF73678.1 hypothetical protein EBI01_08130 [Marinomonas rhizomae]
MNKRIRFTIIFSTPDFPYQEVLDWLSPKLGELFAGACCHAIDGVWSKDGDQNKAQYKKGEIEKGMKILLSVTSDKQEQSKQQIKEIFQDLKKELGLHISWIHLEQEEIEANHFYLPPC